MLCQETIVRLQSRPYSIRRLTHPQCYTHSPLRVVPSFEHRGKGMARRVVVRRVRLASRLEHAKPGGSIGLQRVH